MIKYNKILVPYDNSKLSDTAFDHAMTIAKISSISSGQIVNVILLYVTPIIHTLYSIYYWNYLIKIKENR
jgi:nucleotide-binding universal stress UspA family protein